MRNFLIATAALLILSACDNPEDFHHPENPKKPGILEPTNQGVVPVGTPSATPAIGTNQPPPPVVPPAGPRDASATKTTEVKVDSEFDSVSADGGMEVNVTVGAPAKVSIECNEKSIAKMKTEIKDNTLKITTPADFTAAVAKVTVFMPAVKNLSTNGLATINVNNLKGGALNVTVSGSSTIRGAGAVDDLTVTTSGACLADMKTLVAQNAKVTTSDKSVAEVNVKGTVDGTAHGASVINVSGTPKSAQKHKDPGCYINVN